MVEEEDIFFTEEDTFFSLWLICVEEPEDPGNLMAEKLLRGLAVARLRPSLPSVETRLGLLRPTFLSLKSGNSNISVPSGDVTEVGIVVLVSPTPPHSSILISSPEGRSWNEGLLSPRLAPM